MSALRADLHIHTCLSPCAEDDLTPATAAGLAKLAGADLIAVTDHNSALSLPAAKAACDAYGLQLLPGVEANNRALPAFPNDPAIWGRQLVMDENDQVLDQVPKLLTGALDLSLAQTAALCRSLGGIPVPAHADADSYSLFSVLGGWPMDTDFDLLEVRDPEHAAKLVRCGFFPAEKPMFFSSDAHRMEDVACRLCEMDEDFPLVRLLKK